ncbi:enoyl-CoA hydratase/isomerase family protein [Pseudonocardia alaniniphila]|uniref:Enoyl-CoA hydratase/isomerase family protein n=1 Tax=Pseudonocardia alaniniphila TaxID=75291 RepID=A0ABS9T6U5_9PSEU|nr:enoyl-CoA hydratase/isomerase family protein [Pseudonocardia alaniniphila]MCH6164257.1 enoyl-CoA hydratase/isomerase family protein [Pseudonocardia alaniniphila]
MNETPLQIERKSAEYWTVTFDNPPLNLLDPEVVLALRDLLATLETDEAVKVVVFNSADEDYFISHFDVVRAAEMPGPGPTGLPAWTDIVVRLDRAPFVSIAAIRGRARGVGSEFVLACDLRFASRERAILGQPEVGAALVPGGGALEALPRLVGRSRALEIVLAADDFDAVTAERYGWINRAVADADLYDVVDTIATRIAGFDRDALSTAKRIITQRADPVSAEDINESAREFRRLAVSPAGRARVAHLLARGMQQRSEFELNFGTELARPDASPT